MTLEDLEQVNAEHSPGPVGDDQVCNGCMRPWPCLYARLRIVCLGLVIEMSEVEQTLGKALGYPWYKDDPKNFPNATEEDGVCVGEHTASTLAAEAANRLRG